MQKALPTFYNKPILGSFDSVRDDFGRHDSSDVKWDNDYENPYYDYTGGRYEVPLGLIRQSDEVKMVKKDDGLDWIVVSAAIWVQYAYKQTKKLLRSKSKKISVEVDVNDYYTDENGVDVITDFTLLGITILSDSLETGIADAHLIIPELMNDAVYQKKAQSLCFAYQKLDEALGVENSPDTDKQDFSDSNSPIDNENTDEITMDNENEEGGEKSPMFTLEEKRQMIEVALTEHFSDEDEHACIWVQDLDDERVYYSNCGDGCFSVPYTINTTEDGSSEVSFNFEETQRIVRSWKVYSENEKDDEDKSEEDECKMAAHEDECDMSSDSNEAEDKDKECKMSEEGKEEDECDMAKEDECDMSADSNEKSEEDDKEDECKMSAEDSDESDDDSHKEEESCDEPHEEDESCEDKAENEYVANEMPIPAAQDGNAPGLDVGAVSGIDTGLLDDHDDGSVQGVTGSNPAADEAEIERQTGIVFSVDGEDIDANELYARYTALTEKYNALLAEQTKAFNDSCYAHICEYVGAETDLSAEDADAIKATMSELCKNSTFATIDAAETHADDLIAKALYAAKKAAKAVHNQEFSATIVTNTPVVEHTVKSDVEVLQDARNKLRNL